MNRKDKIELAIIYGLAAILLVAIVVGYTLYTNSGPKAQATQCQYPNRTLSNGDLNGDGTVGQADLDQLLAHFNTSDKAGDVNGDGRTDLVDLSILVSNWDAPSACDNSDPCDPQDAAKGGNGACSDAPVQCQEPTQPQYELQPVITAYTVELTGK